VVLCVGRVRRYKRVDHAIRAIKRVREQIAGARLVVVGEGRDEARLKGLARAAGVQDAVEFAGRVSEQEKVDWIRRSALLLSTSAKEGWGLTVIEANACGVPAVAYDVPGLRDSIRPDTGCLVASGDVAKLAEAVMALLNDEPRRQECCRRAVAWAARFTWDRCAAETLEALQDAVQARA
jgi:glycosyltransferase involved in cell wall biosynthesis